MYNPRQKTGQLRTHNPVIASGRIETTELDCIAELIKIAELMAGRGDCKDEIDEF
jgi:hypothetical protein